MPSDRPLDDLTAELTRMLGDPDPAQRDGTAFPTLTTWIERGVYDDLLAGLGDGMATGLRVGLGERDTDTVFRRSFSALVLGECIARDNVRPLLPRHFDSLSEAENENGQSRIYLGIHWAFDKTAGIAQGRRIADHVFDTGFTPLR